MKEKKFSKNKKKRKVNLINFSVNEHKIKNISKLKSNNLVSIGDWCEILKNIYIEKKKYEYFNFYKSKNLRKKTQDIRFIIETYEYFLKILTDRLNYIHKKKENKKFWEILLGRWLFTYVQNIYSRWQIVHKIKSNFELESVITSYYDNSNFIPYNTQDAHWIMNSPNNAHWNTAMFNEIIKFIYKNSINFKYFKTVKNLNHNYNFFNNIFYSKVINFSLKKKIFFYDLSLNKKIKSLLMLKNNFLNFQFKKKKIFLNKKINHELRDELTSGKKVLKNNFYKFIHEDIKYRLPKIFFEDFNELENAYRNLNWPQAPDYILSSHAQYYDEVFKYYCAKKIKKTKLFILQHGYGNFFADRDVYNFYMDKKVSTKFLTWGKNIKDNSKAFVFPFKSLVKKKINLNKKIIFIIYAFNEKPYLPINGFISGNQVNIKIIKLVEGFITKSNYQVQKNCYAKLLSNSMVNSVQKSIKFKFPDLVFLDPKKRFSQIINDFNISVHFFLGTPFFESMHHNKPCILVLDREVHINFDKNFLSVIGSLRKNKICFEKIDGASKFMNDNYDNILSWWENDKVKKSRENFCEKYCRDFDKNKNILKKLF